MDKYDKPICSIKKKRVIGFTGNMFYYPNIDAVLWFINNCWNKLKEYHSDLELWIVGRNPDYKILNFDKKNSIFIFSNVDSILDFLNENILISIAPMQSGSGMQFKILEAFSVNVPVVSTTLGLGDIKALDKESIILGNTPNEFIDSILFLLDSDSLRKSISENAKYVLEENYSWTYIDSILIKLYNQLNLK